MKKLFVLLLILACSGAWAQEFGFGSEPDSTDGSAPSAKSKPSSSKREEAGGSITVELSPYVRDFKKNEGTQEIHLRDMISGSLYIWPEASNSEAYLAFNINADSINELRYKDPKLYESNYTPLIVDEAYIKAYIGSVNIETGYRKLAWGKADSPGPLDITNPTDYSDIRNITDTKAIKIARLMLHVTWNAGAFSKLEGVFIPNFAGHRFAEDGRWQPYQTKNMRSTVEEEISSKATEKFMPIAIANPALIPVFMGVRENLRSSVNEIPYSYPSTGTLDNYQAGLRYTTTVGSVDIGGQYFYGHLFRPTFTVAGVDAFLDDLASGILGASPPLTLNPNYPANLSLISPVIKYNRYHQIGVDYAQVLFGFNLRAEVAVHITEDRSGDDGSVQNPFIGWSLGFDRDIIWGVNVNVQCNETVRLLNDKIGDNPILDAEADTNAINTRLTARLSKKFLMDKLEPSATVIWNIEDSDYHIIPALKWTEDDITLKLSAGIFAGKETGELGQYWRNNYVRFSVTYSF
ncbi:hypothetical protein [Treponema sp. R6D11]